MATTTKVFQVSLQGLPDSIKQVETLNTTLAKTEQELVNVDKESSISFKELSAQANKSRESLDKVNKTLSTVTSAKTAEGAKKVGESFQGAFSSAQIAADAFGVSTGALNGAVTKAQAAVQALDGVKKVFEGLTAENLKFVTGAVGGFKNMQLGAVLFGNATRAALAATGIGLFIVALGSIIAYWDDIATGIGLADDEQKKLTEDTLHYYDIVASNSKKTYDTIVNQLENELKILKAKRASVDEISAAEVKLAQVKAHAAEEEFDTLTASNRLKIDQLRKDQEATDDIEERKKLEEEENALIKANYDLTFKRNNAEADVTVAVEQRKNALADEAEKTKAINDKKIADEKAAEEEFQSWLRERKDAAREEQSKKDREQKLKDYASKLTAGIQIPDAKTVAAQMQVALDARNKALADAQKNAPPVRSILDYLIGTNPDGTEVESNEDKAVAIQAAFQAVTETIGLAMNAVFANMDENIQKTKEELDNVTTQLEEQSERVDETRNNLAGAEGARRERLLDQLKEEEQREKQLAAEKEKIAAKLAKEQKKRAQLKKASDLAQAIGGTALAVVNALQTTPFVPLGLIAAIAAGAAGAVQVASISGQDYGAQGGVLMGPSHANGGIRTPFGEMEGGEALINKRSTAMFLPQLSALNVAGGGRPLTGPHEEGTITGVDYSSLNQSSSTNVADQITNALKNYRPIVTVADISDVASTQNQIEVRATY